MKEITLLFVLLKLTTGAQCQRIALMHLFCCVYIGTENLIIIAEYKCMQQIPSLVVIDKPTVRTLNVIIHSCLLFFIGHVNPNLGGRGGWRGVVNLLPHLVFP